MRRFVKVNEISHFQRKEAPKRNEQEVPFRRIWLWFVFVHSRNGLVKDCERLEETRGKSFFSFFEKKFPIYFFVFLFTLFLFAESKSCTNKFLDNYSVTV